MDNLQLHCKHQEKTQARQAPLPKPIINLVLLGLPLEVFACPLALGVLQESLALLGIPGWFLGRPLGRPWTFLGVLWGTVWAEFQHLGATAAKVLAILMLFGTLARSCNEFQRQRGSMGQRHW